MAKVDLTLENLQKFLHYDKDTGLFTRVSSKQFSRWCGKPAGYTDKHGYIRIRFMDGKIHKAHRLAWLYVYGVMPNQEIDHIDGNPSNNKIDNLREICKSGNRQNTKRASVNNSAGLLGVFPRYNGKWQAAITYGGKKYHLGTFDTKEAAAFAYQQAKRTHHTFYVH